ncbi:hypothetical protein OF83DRAFT_1160671 [Amylostereum chailletii]|nr:hypothetical protein OF83DRAFT_1160671 [Amylostereum chailletii]
MHGVQFVPADEPAPFGFIDPDQIIRAAYLEPAFAYGQNDLRLGPSVARQDKEEDKDWEMYYVNPFVDRDMLMRFRGGGVGHLGTRHLNPELEEEHHWRPDPVRAFTGSALDEPFDSDEEDATAEGAETNVAEEEVEGEGEEDEEGNEEDEEDEEEDEEEIVKEDADEEWLDLDDENTSDERVLEIEGFAPL